MTSKLVIRPRAVLDIDEQSLYIAASSEKSARRFQVSAQLSMARLAESPDLGAQYDADAPQLSGLRFWPIRGFPNHLICYRPIGGGVEILRIFHGARDMPSALDN